MNKPTTGNLKVPGASLYHEVRGAGTVLLLIPGGNGDAGAFERMANKLAQRYTVVSYDRRGFSRSPLDRDAISSATAPSLDDRRGLEADTDDICRLLDRLSLGPAYVFGSSSGAIIALDLAARHPERVRSVVAHEPPALTLLKDATEQLAFMDEVYAIYRRSGVGPAMQKFVAGIGLSDRAPPPGTKLAPHVAELMSRIDRNREFWLEHELRQYTRVVPDLVALKALSTRLILAGGRDSCEHLPYRPNLVLAERLGSTVVDFPGDHIGYVTHPVDFAARLVEVLAQPDATRPSS